MPSAASPRRRAGPGARGRPRRRRPRRTGRRSTSRCAVERRGAAGRQAASTPSARRAGPALRADDPAAAGHAAAAEPPLRSGRRGGRIDLRRTLRSSLRTGGDPIRLRRRRRVVPAAGHAVRHLGLDGAVRPGLPAVPDLRRRQRAERRGVRVRHPAHPAHAGAGSRNPERAIQRAAAAAPDWSSGTRIGDALHTFNDRHGRRGMARGAVVVILSDGWERGDPEKVGREMERLSRLAHRIVWVNPRVAARSFSVQAGGMVAALPYCDALVSGHSFEALAEVVEAIGAATRNRRPPRPPHRATSPSPGPAPRRSPGARWRCRAVTGRARATPRQDG